MNYMFLLKTHFGQISFVPHMMYVHANLLASDASFDAKKLFCSKYLFKYEKPEQTNTFIFSMNPGMHWIAFKIDFLKKYIATMCSLNNRLNQEANKLKECISSIHPAATPRTAHRPRAHERTPPRDPNHAGNPGTPR